MKHEKILVIGACGQIGSELIMKLRELHGASCVVAADIKEPTEYIKESGPFLYLNALDKDALHTQLRKQQFTQVYLLAAVLSAVGEQDPRFAWDVNMQGLLNLLDAAKENKVKKIFWPSSIAVFGKNAPKLSCPQQSVLEPQTMYGTTKVAGELLCRYYFEKYGVDVRSIRYPGLISYLAAPGGGTTDYAVDIFHAAIDNGGYTCFLDSTTLLPMMYMPDAIRATVELMDVPADRLSVRTSYNIAAMSFTPRGLAAEIQKHLPDFSVTYAPDYRQDIADSWPGSIDDTLARKDWGWAHDFDLSGMTVDMLKQLSVKRAKGSAVVTGSNGTVT
jgi:nucleoside-diphosphate-sugar epimerase